MKEIKKLQKPRRKRTDGFTIEFKKLMESNGYRHVINDGFSINSKQKINSPAYEKKLSRTMLVWFSYHGTDDGEATINWGTKTNYSSKKDEMDSMNREIEFATNEIKRMYILVTELKEKCAESQKAVECDNELKKAEAEYKAKIEAIKSKYSGPDVQTSLF